MRGCRKLCKLDLCGLKERATELIFKGLLETDCMLCARLLLAYKWDIFPVPYFPVAFGPLYGSVIGDANPEMILR